MKLQQLKDKIYARLPELKELSFGCEIGNGYQDVSNPFHRRIFIRYTENGMLTRCVYEGEVSFSELCYSDKEDPDSKFIMYGHPITPTHILRCLGSDYAMDGDGQFFEPLITHAFGRIMIPIQMKINTTNFSIDNLDEETIDFLLNNIK